MDFGVDADVAADACDAEDILDGKYKIVGFCRVRPEPVSSPQNPALICHIWPQKGGRFFQDFPTVVHKGDWLGPPLFDRSIHEE